MWNNIHAKLVTVDGCKSFVHGANFQAHMPKCDWMDLGVGISGKSVAHKINACFLSMWRISSEFNAQRIRLKNVAKRPKCSPSPGEHTDIEVLFHPACAMCLRNRRSTVLIERLHDTLKRAKKYLDIISPNIADTRVIKLFIAAASRGVKIRIISTLGHNELAFKVFSMATNAKMHKNLGDVKNIDIRYSNAYACNLEGKKCRKCDMKGTLYENKATLVGVNHSKLVIADKGEVVIVGSTNLDPFSLTFSAEMSILMKNVTKSNIIFERYWNSSGALKLKS